MQTEQVAFHNVAALEEQDGLPGAFLVRYPASVRAALSDRGRYLAAEATGSEIRFVAASPAVRLRVLAIDSDTDIYLFRGDFLHQEKRLPAGVVTTIALEEPARIPRIPEAMRQASAFSPDVWRVQFNRSRVAFLGIEAGNQLVRPPLPEELPRQRYLAYGSSITHASAYHGYVFHAARRLRADVLNMGLSGSCRCEPEVADYLASREDWDFATLELGINMRGGFSTEAFAERAGYLVERITSAHPQKPVFLITIYPNWLSYGTDSGESAEAEREQAFNDVLRDLAAEKAGQGRRVFLVEGTDVLDPTTGLLTDLLHPAPHGHAIMGENLARQIAAHLNTEAKAE
ncbi:MAG: hypothetical protein OHK0029_42290 [Armatimonadaceae bacterium]